MGNTISANAASKTVSSTYSTQCKVAATTITIESKCKIYGSALCTEGSALGHIAMWEAKMYGDHALTYTVGACSFGANGQTANIMSKSKFVKGSSLVSYSETAPKFTYYSSASTTLYY